MQKQLRNAGKKYYRGGRWVKRLTNKMLIFLALVFAIFICQLF